jgi:hypothetical protein
MTTERKKEVGLPCVLPHLQNPSFFMFVAINISPFTRMRKSREINVTSVSQNTPQQPQL